MKMIYNTKTGYFYQYFRVIKKIRVHLPLSIVKLLVISLYWALTIHNGDYKVVCCDMLAHIICTCKDITSVSPNAFTVHLFEDMK